MEDTRVSSTRFDSKEEAQKYLSANQYSEDKLASGNLDKVSFNSLFEMAKIERVGVSYNKKKLIPEAYSSYENEHFPAHEKTVERTLYQGNPARYAEICNMISSKLLYSSEEQIKEFESVYANNLTDDEVNAVEDPTIDTKQDAKTQEDVYQILKDEYQKNTEYLVDLAAYAETQKDMDIQQCVAPLRKALAHTNEATGPLSGPEALKLLSQFNSALLGGGEDSIAQKLKATGDPLVLKILKSIFLTLRQAITGETSHGIIDNLNNPAERLAKNAEKMMPSADYQCLQHLRNSVSAEAKLGSEKEVSQKTESGASPTPTTTKGPG